MTTTDADLGWLAGIIDGEGTVSLSHGGNRSPHLRISIYNGSDEIIAKVLGILDRIDVGYHTAWDKRAARHNMHVTITTPGAIRIYALLGDMLVRHIDRLRAAVEFLEPCYEGRTRVHWTAAQRAEWEGLRRRFNAA